MTDQELIHKVHNGSKEALNTIVERYYDEIYRFFLYLTGQETDSYEIVYDSDYVILFSGSAHGRRNLHGERGKILREGFRSIKMINYQKFFYNFSLTR